MTQPSDTLPELAQLLGALADEQLDAAGKARLLQVLSDDPAARSYYLDYMDLHARLQWKQTSEEGLRLSTGAAVELSVGAAVELPHQPGVHSPDSPVPSPESLIPPIIIDPSPTIHYPLFTIHSSLGGWLFSYAAATVIMAVAVLVSWAWKVSLHDEIAVVNKDRLTAPGGDAVREAEPVGRITGLADCRWADPQHAPPAAVTLGRKYELAAGLVEITYKTGATIILQGPCTYEVESLRGGFLSLGKLTARVEGREVRGQGSEIRNQKSEISNPRSLIPNPSPLFVVKTPTAIVTDLGTEFGVEVSKEGNTTSHVFRGSVKVRPAAGAAEQPEQPEVVLRENESVRVERAKDAGSPRLVRLGAADTHPAFVRQLTAPPKLLDLLDIVAGDNGTGHRREHGIDPSTGRIDWNFCGGPSRVGDHHFWPTTWSLLIDGVFIPDGAAGAVQLDSAGHTFQGFPKTGNKVYGSIWARAADAPYADTKFATSWIYAIGRPRQFMPQGRGLLGMHANVGIALDLEHVRKMYQGGRPSKFRATAGVADARPQTPEADGSADLWIFVDGRLKWKRVQLRPQDGPVEVDLVLGPGDRFLTLVTTDGGRPQCWPWAVFGDPVLEMTTTESETK